MLSPCVCPFVTLCISLNFKTICTKLTHKNTSRHFFLHFLNSISKMAAILKFCRNFVRTTPLEPKVGFLLLASAYLVYVPIWKKFKTALFFLQTDLLVCILILCCSHIDRKSNITMEAISIFELKNLWRAPGYLWEL